MVFSKSDYVVIGGILVAAALGLLTSFHKTAILCVAAGVVVVLLAYFRRKKKNKF